MIKRIIPCLDVNKGRVVKGVKFLNLRDSGDPVELSVRYEEEGADEIVFLDISASIEGRKTLFNIVKETARNLSIPLTVGGGITSLEDIYNAFSSGADKVSINTAAVMNPEIITKGAEEFGRQAIVLAIDAKKEGNSWKVYIKGGKERTELDVIEWAIRGVELGAGELLVTSIDKDGTRTGYDIDLIREVSNKVNVPVIASGGAGHMEHFYELFLETNADAALAAGIFHEGKVRIYDLKKYLSNRGIEVRLIDSVLA
jgi:cyclase